MRLRPHAEDLIGGYKQIIERAHTFGIKVIGGTLPPYGGANSSRESGKRFAKRSITGFAPAGPMTASSILKLPRATKRIPSGCGRSSIPATTCTKRRGL